MPKFVYKEAILTITCKNTRIKCHLKKKAQIIEEMTQSMLKTLIFKRENIPMSTLSTWWRDRIRINEAIGS